MQVTILLVDLYITAAVLSIFSAGIYFFHGVDRFLYSQVEGY